MNQVRQRARNAMLGLAIGDALSWPAMFHRSRLLPIWTRRIRRDIDASSEQSHVLTVAMPFSLNQRQEVFKIAATDDTEWAAFTTNILIERGDFEASLGKAWRGLAASDGPVRGSISAQAALRNLRKGLLPPRSGKENPHYFDDSALARAVPIGVFNAGNPAKAAGMAVLDASVTHAEEGVWGAQAFAAAISLACAGANIDKILETSREFLPASSLIRRKVDGALAFAVEGQTLFSLLPDIQNTIVNQEYSYGNAAPETLAVALLIAKMIAPRVEDAITVATSFAKTADALPAVVGALTGAMNTDDIAGPRWASALSQLTGVCIPSLAGTNYLDLTERLADSAAQNYGGGI